MVLQLRVFTHPACTGCGAAVKWAWQLQEEYPAHFRLRTVKLESKQGLDEAHAEKVKTIPTLILSEGEKELDRIIGVPQEKDKERFLKHTE